MAVGRRPQVPTTYWLLLRSTGVSSQQNSWLFPEQVGQESDEEERDLTPLATRVLISDITNHHLCHIPYFKGKSLSTSST